MIMQFTLQQVFDKTVLALAAQGEKAYDCNAHNCAYSVPGKGGKTLKCAYGVWIPDALYDKGMEGGGIGNPEHTDGPYKDRLALLHKAAGLVKGSQHHELMFMLQQAHDSTTNLAGFRVQLTKVAAKFSLDGAVIGKVEKWKVS